MGSCSILSHRTSYLCSKSSHGCHLIQSNFYSSPWPTLSGLANLSDLTTHHFSLAHSVPPALAFLLFLKCTTCSPTSEPLLWLFPLPRLFFPHISTWLTLSPPSGHCSDGTFSMMPSLLTSSKIAPPPPFILYSPDFFYF